MAFYLYIGNKLERLAQCYAEEVYSSSADVFAPSTVVVQTQGMAAWLKLYLAAHTEIAVNLQFPFLKSFMEDTLIQTFPDFLPSKHALSGELLHWRVFQLLAERPEAYPELAFYLRGPEADRKRWQLSGRIADLLDQYQAYRGDLLAEWRRRPDHFRDWQTRLYLELFERGGGLDFYLERFRRLSPAQGAEGQTPIALFGISSMPPVFLEFYLKLAEFRDVHFFYLNPSSEFWQDAYSEKEIARLSEQTGEDPADLLLRNPLLGAFGGHGRGFFSLMMDLQERENTVVRELFDSFLPEDSPPSMLTVLQEDIRRNLLRSPNANPDGAGSEMPWAPDPGDDSIQIHDCHSVLREVEVLHDVLLKSLADDRTLEPRDILVMAPDIQTYEPCIHAVFGSGPLKDFYAVSDHTLNRESSAAAALLEILKMGGTKYEQSRVLNLLSVPAVRRKYDLSEESLTAIGTWCADAGIRWGLDAEHRNALTGVSYDDYSWRAGLDRLLLGYAVSSDPIHQADDPILPLDSAEGNAAVVLGAFLLFARNLFEFRSLLSTPHPLNEWSSILDRVTDCFFLSDSETYAEIAAMKHCFRHLREISEEVHFSSPVAPEVLVEIVSSGIETPEAGKAFLRGKITFCSMVPMRSIPMKVTALLGLNDGTFPRSENRIGFDLILRDPRKYDRSRIAEDRYLFLEAILAARKKLIFFYQGRNDRDDSVYPPAVPLGELLDTLSRSFDPLPPNLIRKHRLHGFSADYFTPGHPLYSFSKTEYHACRALETALAGGDGEKTEKDVFSPSVLREKIEAHASVSEMEILRLEDLERILISPVNQFCRDSLGLPFAFESELENPDLEPLSLSPLEETALRKDLSELSLKEHLSAEQLLSLMRKSGRLPVAGGGIQAFQTACAGIRSMPEEFRILFQQIEPLPLDLTFDGVRILGSIPVSLRPDTHERIQPYTRFAAIKGRDAVRWYLRHLLLLLSSPEGEEPETRLWDGRTQWSYRLPRADGAERFQGMLNLCREAKKRPVALFPYASFDYAVHKNKTSARRVFCDDYHRTGDFFYDPSVPLFFHPDEVVDLPEFASFSELVFQPYFNEEVLPR